MNRKTLFLALAFLSLKAIANGPTYTVTDLGDLPGGLEASFAEDVNENGVVVGIGTGPNGDLAFKWTRSGGMVALPLLPGTTQSRAYNVNSIGQVNGDCFVTENFETYRPAFWTSTNQIVNIGIPSGFSWAFCGGMNDHGQLVGWGQSPTGRKGWTWTESTGFQVTNPANGAAECGFSDINNRGAICGWNDNDAMVWNNGVPTALEMGAGGTSAYPNMMTDEGRIGGYVVLGGGLYTAGQWNLEGKYLQSPQLPGYPSMDCFTASSEGGMIFGSAYGPGFEHATVWSPVDGLTKVSDLIDPTTPGWALKALFATPSGVLAGWGEIGGVTHACVAVPVVSPHAMNVTLGKQSGGLLASLSGSDNDPVTVCRFFVPNQQVAPVTVEFDATSPIKSPFAYNLRVESRVTTGGAFNQTLDLYDWSTNSYSTVDARTDTLNTSYKTLELKASGNLDRYVGPGRTLRARLRVKPIGPVGSAQWCTDIERVQYVTQL